MDALLERAVSCPPVRLVFVINTLAVGGAERQLTRVVRELHATGRWNVSVYSIVRQGQFVEAIEDAGIEVAGQCQPWSKSPRHVFRCVCDLYAYLIREQPEIVHCYLERAGFVGALAGRAAAVPHIITSRMGAPYSPSPESELVRRTTNWISDRCSEAIVAISEATRAQAIREGAPESKLVTLYNGVLPASPVAPGPRLFPGNPVIGTVGTLRQVKGHRVLLEAAPRILAALPQTHFVLAGTGPERKRLEALARELEVADRVRFLGQRADIPAVLAAFDVFVLPSLGEGMPNAVLEAMVAGLPVVASRVGGIPEVVEDGKSGLLVEPDSPGALADALICVGREQQLRRTMGQRGRHRALTTFSPQTELAETEALYYRLLGREPDRYSCL